MMYRKDQLCGQAVTFQVQGCTSLPASASNWAMQLPPPPAPSHALAGCLPLQPACIYVCGQLISLLLKGCLHSPLLTDSNKSVTHRGEVKILL